MNKARLFFVPDLCLWAYKKYLTVPYVQNLTEPTKRVLQQVGVGVAIKPVSVLSNIFCKPKDKGLDKEKSGLVHHISCRDCDAVYIGETCRSLDTRKREHIDAVNSEEF